jgi:hypothetical protein
MAEKQKETLGRVKAVLKDETAIQFLHQHFSASCFNQCWTLIDKRNRTDAEVEDMLLLANASLWHWKQRKDCKPMNLSIAYWQLGRVNCLARNTDLAKNYGEMCIKISRDGKLPPFYLGYGYEVMVHACVLEKDVKNAKRYLDLAKAELAKITVDENRKLLKADLTKLEKQLGKAGKQVELVNNSIE